MTASSPSAVLSTVELGSYPTPLVPLAGAAVNADLWVKDDGRTATTYGGNKVRKLERLLDVALRRRARRILTIGAAGSHHVLATCVYAQRLELPTCAVLTPQPWSEHADATLRAGVSAGLTVVPARSYADALLALRRHRRPGDFVIGPGGAGLEGTWAYCLALDELAEQLERARLPPFDAIFVAAGSGSTAAGLLAGVLRRPIARRVVAVGVTPNPALRTLVVGQAVYALSKRCSMLPLRRALGTLSIESRFIGGGYGHSTPAGERAAAVARSFGLSLEPTYTAKAFAAALHWANDEGRSQRDRSKLRLQRRRTCLYWHTLSSVPLAALLERAPKTLPDELAHLLRKPYS